MKGLRPYRFPPLAQLHVESSPQAGMFAQQQAAFAEEYQNGFDKGYRDGFESGAADGRREGRAEGRSEGVEEGRREVLARFELMAGPIDAMLDNLKQIQAEYQAALRKEVVELVAKVARQVIRCELALQPTQLLALIDETLATMPPTREGVEVYLNPEDLERIRELAPERVDRWNLVADASMEHGECRVKAGGREADAGCRQRLAACMEQVREQLLEAEERVEVCA